MINKKTGSFMLIWGSIIVALILSIIKLPAFLSDYLPNYASLVLMVWVVAFPNKVNVFSGWITGLFMDFLLGTTLGIHAAAFSFMIWLLHSQFESFRFYSLVEVTVVVATINLIGQFVLFWSEHIFGVVTADYHIIWSSITCLVIWPLLYLILVSLHRLIIPQKDEYYV